MEVMLNNTTKPIVFVTPDFEGCVDAVEMTEAVAGSAEALRQRPLIACYINVTSALVHNQEALQKLLYLSGKGLPYTYIPVTTGGMTGSFVQVVICNEINRSQRRNLCAGVHGSPPLRPDHSGRYGLPRFRYRHHDQLCLSCHR
jgi:hypothetical protein